MMNQRMMNRWIVFGRLPVLLACVLFFGCTGPTQDADTTVEPDVSDLVAGDEVEPDAVAMDTLDTMVEDLDVAPP